jgi:MYXO-CTERM domain-containing protein
LRGERFAPSGAAGGTDPRQNYESEPTYPHHRCDPMRFLGSASPGGETRLLARHRNRPFVAQGPNAGPWLHGSGTGIAIEGRQRAPNYRRQRTGDHRFQSSRHEQTNPRSSMARCISSATVVLTFDTDQTGGDYVWYENPVVTPPTSPGVPEPSSLVAWAGLGAMGLLMAWRRRKQVAA